MSNPLLFVVEIIGAPPQWINTAGDGAQAPAPLSQEETLAVVPAVRLTDIRNANSIVAPGDPATLLPLTSGGPPALLAEARSRGDGYCWLDIFPAVHHTWFRREYGPFVTQHELRHIVASSGVFVNMWQRYQVVRATIRNFTIWHITLADEGQSLYEILFNGVYQGEHNLFGGRHSKWTEDHLRGFELCSTDVEREEYLVYFNAIDSIRPPVHISGEAYDVTERAMLNEAESQQEYDLVMEEIVAKRRAYQAPRTVRVIDVPNNISRADWVRTGNYLKTGKLAMAPKNFKNKTGANEKRAGKSHRRPHQFRRQEDPDRVVPTPIVVHKQGNAYTPLKMDKSKRKGKHSRPNWKRSVPTATKEGKCYLRLFRQCWRQRAWAALGANPTARAVCMFQQTYGVGTMSPREHCLKMTYSAFGQAHISMSKWQTSSVWKQVRMAGASFISVCIGAERLFGRYADITVVPVDLLNIGYRSAITTPFASYVTVPIVKMSFYDPSNYRSKQVSFDEEDMFLAQCGDARFTYTAKMLLGILFRKRKDSWLVGWTSNSAQADFLRRFRPDVLMQYAALEKSLHQQGTAFEIAYELDSTFRRDFWLAAVGFEADTFMDGPIKARALCEANLSCLTLVEREQFTTTNGNSFTHFDQVSAASPNFEVDMDLDTPTIKPSILPAVENPDHGLYGTGLSTNDWLDRTAAHTLSYVQTGGLDLLTAFTIILSGCYNQITTLNDLVVRLQKINSNQSGDTVEDASFPFKGPERAHYAADSSSAPSGYCWLSLFHDSYHRELRATNEAVISYKAIKKLATLYPHASSFVQFSLPDENEIAHWARTTTGFTVSQALALDLPDESLFGVEKCTCWRAGQYCHKHKHRSNLDNNGACKSCPLQPTQGVGAWGSAIARKTAKQKAAYEARIMPFYCQECEFVWRANVDEVSYFPASPPEHGFCTGTLSLSKPSKQVPDDIFATSWVPDWGEDTTTTDWEPTYSRGLEFIRDIIVGAPRPSEYAQTRMDVTIAGNKHSIDHYVANSIYKLDHFYVFVAPCGIGKTKFAPGLLLQRFKLQSVVYCSERIIGAEGAYNWYAEKGLTGIGKISMRAGGASRAKVLDPSLRTSMHMATVNSLADGPMAFLHDPTVLLILDEAHTVTDGWLNIMHRHKLAAVKGRACTLILTTATPPFDMPVDLATPRSAKLSFMSSYTPDSMTPIFHQEAPSAKRGLYILASTSAAKTASADWVKVLDRTQGSLVGACKSATIIIWSRDYKAIDPTYPLPTVGRSLGLSALEHAVNTSKRPVYIFATPILQESVTLDIDLVVDCGWRVQPSLPTGSTQVEGLQYTTPTKILNTLSSSLTVPATALEIFQTCGRVGRTDFSDGGRAFIGVADNIKRADGGNVGADKRGIVALQEEAELTGTMGLFTDAKKASWKRLLSQLQNDPNSPDRALTFAYHSLESLKEAGYRCSFHLLETANSLIARYTVKKPTLFDNVEKDNASLTKAPNLIITPVQIDTPREDTVEAASLPPVGQIRALPVINKEPVKSVHFEVDRVVVEEKTTKAKTVDQKTSHPRQDTVEAVSLPPVGPIRTLVVAQPLPISPTPTSNIVASRQPSENTVEAASLPPWGQIRASRAVAVTPSFFPSPEFIVDGGFVEGSFSFGSSSFKSFVGRKMATTRVVAGSNARGEVAGVGEGSSRKPVHVMGVGAKSQLSIAGMYDNSVSSVDTVESASFPVPALPPRREPERAPPLIRTARVTNENSAPRMANEPISQSDAEIVENDIFYGDVKVHVKIPLQAQTSQIWSAAVDPHKRVFGPVSRSHYPVKFAYSPIKVRLPSRRQDTVEAGSLPLWGQIRPPVVWESTPRAHSCVMFLEDGPSPLQLTPALTAESGAMVLCSDYDEKGDLTPAARTRQQIIYYLGSGEIAKLVANINKGIKNVAADHEAFLNLDDPMEQDIIQHTFEMALSDKISTCRATTLEHEREELGHYPSFELLASDYSAFKRVCAPHSADLLIQLVAPIHAISLALYLDGQLILPARYPSAEVQDELDRRRVSALIESYSAALDLTGIRVTGSGFDDEDEQDPYNSGAGESAWNAALLAKESPLDTDVGVIPEPSKPPYRVISRYRSLTKDELALYDYQRMILQTRFRNRTKKPKNIWPVSTDKEVWEDTHIHSSLGEHMAWHPECTPVPYGSCCLQCSNPELPRKKRVVLSILRSKPDSWYRRFSKKTGAPPIGRRHTTDFSMWLSTRPDWSTLSTLDFDWSWISCIKRGWQKLIKPRSKCVLCVKRDTVEAASDSDVRAPSPQPTPIADPTSVALPPVDEPELLSMIYTAYTSGSAKRRTHSPTPHRAIQHWYQLARTNGYCYLRLLRVSKWRAACDSLGSNPLFSDVERFGVDYPKVCTRLPGSTIVHITPESGILDVKPTERVGGWHYKCCGVFAEDSESLGAVKMAILRHNQTCMEYKNVSRPQPPSVFQGVRRVDNAGVAFRSGSYSSQYRAHLAASRRPRAKKTQMPAILGGAIGGIIGAKATHNVVRHMNQLPTLFPGQFVADSRIGPKVALGAVIIGGTAIAASYLTDKAYTHYQDMAARNSEQPSRNCVEPEVNQAPTDKTVRKCGRSSVDSLWPSKVNGLLFGGSKPSVPTIGSALARRAAKGKGKATPAPSSPSDSLDSDKTIIPRHLEWIEEDAMARRQLDINEPGPSRVDPEKLTIPRTSTSLLGAGEWAIPGLDTALAELEASSPSLCTSCGIYPVDNHPTQASQEDYANVDEAINRYRKAFALDVNHKAPQFDDEDREHWIRCLEQQLTRCMSRYRARRVLTIVGRYIHPVAKYLWDDACCRVTYDTERYYAEQIALIRQRADNSPPIVEKIRRLANTGVINQSYRLPWFYNKQGTLIYEYRPPTAEFGSCTILTTAARVALCIREPVVAMRILRRSMLDRVDEDVANCEQQCGQTPLQGDIVSEIDYLEFSEQVTRRLQDYIDCPGSWVTKRHAWALGWQRYIEEDQPQSCVLSQEELMSAFKGCSVTEIEREDILEYRLTQIQCERVVELDSLRLIVKEGTRDARLIGLMAQKHQIIQLLNSGIAPERVAEYLLDRRSPTRGRNAPSIQTCSFAWSSYSANLHTPGYCYLALWPDTPIHRHKSLTMSLGPYPKVRALLSHKLWPNRTRSDDVHIYYFPDSHTIHFTFRVQLPHKNTIRLCLGDLTRFMDCSVGATTPERASLLMAHTPRAPSSIPLVGRSDPPPVITSLSASLCALFESITWPNRDLCAELRRVSKWLSGPFKRRLFGLLELPTHRLACFTEGLKSLFEEIKHTPIDALDNATPAEIAVFGKLYYRLWKQPFVEVPFENITRQRVKPAWALMYGDKQPSRLAQADIRFPKRRGQVTVPLMPLPNHDDTFDEIKQWHAEVIGPAVDESVDELMRQEVVRSFAANPTVDILDTPYADLVRPYKDRWIEPFAREHPLFDNVPLGIDGLAYATPENVWQSLQRYGPRHEADELTKREMEEIADVLYWNHPQLQGHATLLPTVPKKLIKQMHSSNGYPLLGCVGKRRKQDLKDHPTNPPDKPFQSLLWRATHAAAMTLADGESKESISHAFPKGQVIVWDKVRIPGKLRTITGVPFMSQIRERILMGDLSNRRDPWNSYGKPGMPMTGTAFNKMYIDAEDMKYHYAWDGSKYDSTVSKKVMETVAALSKKGYDWHPDRDLIHAAIDASEAATFNGHIVNLVAQPDSEYRHIRKEGGYYTGHGLVTYHNTRSLQVCFIAILMRVWNMSAKEVCKNFKMENIGDDSLFHTNREIDTAAFIKQAKVLTGVDFRLEDFGTTIEGVEFLSKRGYLLTTEDRELLRCAGVENVDHLKYRVEHSKSSMLMRYCTLQLSGHTKATVMKSDTRLGYFISRAIGYLYLTSHHKDAYDYIVTDVERLIKMEEDRVIESFRGTRMTPKEKGRLNYHLQMIQRYRTKKEFQLPTYEKVLRTHYAPLPADMGQKHLVSYNLVLWDWINTKAYRMDNKLRKVRRFIKALDPEFWDLPDPVAPSDIPLRFSGVWRSTNEVERFIFYRAIERGYEETGGLVIPNLEEFADLCRQSPFFGQTDTHSFMLSEVPRIVEQFRRHEVAGVDMLAFTKRAVTRLRFRMAVLSALYSVLCTSVNKLPSGFTSLGPLVFDLILQGQRRAFAWMSYSYWLDQGRGSHAISNLAPKDAYGAYKFIAVKLLNTLLPQSIYIPDIFQGVMPQWGHVLEKVAESYTWFMGLASRKIGNTSIVPSAERGLQNNPWEAESLAIMEALFSPEAEMMNGRALILNAPTGTGKTFWFPMASVTRSSFELSDRNVSIHNHIVIVPTRILAQETKWLDHSMYHKGWLRRRNPRVQNDPDHGDGKFVMGSEYDKALYVTTAGHARAIWAELSTLDRESTVFQVDEYHFQQPDQLWLVHTALSLGFSVILSTATPSLRIDRNPYPNYNSSMSRKHDIRSIRLATNETWAFDALMRSEEATRLGYNNRIMIIHPSLTRCRVIETALRDRASMYNSTKPFEIKLLHAGDRTVPKRGHIVATQMVDAGVTLDIDTVIDCGLSIVTHLGCVQTIGSTTTTSIQRKGRVGRKRDGLYIALREPSTTPDAIQIPDIMDLMEHEETWRTIYGDRWAFTSMFCPSSASQHDSILFNGLAKCEDLEAIGALGHGSARPDVELYLRILCMNTATGDVDDLFRRTNSAYTSLMAGRPLDSVEHLFTTRKPITSPSVLQRLIENDRILWHTVLGFQPGIPRVNGTELGLALHVPSVHPGIIPKDQMALTRRPVDQTIANNLAAVDHVRNKLNNLIKGNALTNEFEMDTVEDDSSPIMGPGRPPSFVDDSEALDNIDDVLSDTTDDTRSDISDNYTRYRRDMEQASSSPRVSGLKMPPKSQPARVISGGVRLGIATTPQQLVFDNINAVSHDQDPIAQSGFGSRLFPPG